MVAAIDGSVQSKIGPGPGVGPANLHLIGPGPGPDSVAPIIFGPGPGPRTDYLTKTIGPVR